MMSISIHRSKYVYHVIHNATIRLYSKDYFAIFTLPRSFDVSKNDLKTAYHKLMEENHPDRLSNQKEGQGNTAGDVMSPSAAIITQAYTALLNPYERAVHILELHGKSLEESKKNPNGPSLGIEFLLQVMEIREVIESTTENDQLLKLLQDNRSRIDNVCMQLTEAFDANELEKAVQLTQELQYWNRIDETLRQKTEIH
jgi:molecular chaperone HscB